MNSDNSTLICIIVLGIVLFIMWTKRHEGFSTKCKNYIPGDISHCPRECTPFLYPDMYQPLDSCSDPFKWGFTYSTGRCPHTYIQEKDTFTHGGGADYSNKKHARGPGYTFAYDYA